MSGGGLRVRGRLVAGLLFVLPFAATLWLVLLLFDFVDRAFASQALALLGVEGEPGLAVVWSARLAGLAACLAGLYALGLIATNMAGRMILRLGDRAIGGIPLLGTIYLALRQVIEALGASRSSAFRRCVAIEYPRRGLWTIAFVMNDVPFRAVPSGDPSVPVFVPTTPNPTSGFLILVPEADCHPLDISVEEGVKMVVSAGIVLPPERAREGPPPEVR